MRIIISPAKKMRVDTDTFPCQGEPAFLESTQTLLHKLQGMSYEDLKKLWKCNDEIARQNVQRLENMELRGNLTPALIAYEGIQYQYMAPGVFEEEAYGYLQEHLRILSGFYGVLRPFDGVTPYRLEMQAKLPVGEKRDLYAFWGNRLAENVFSGTDCVLNLASKEYSRCIFQYRPASASFITCVFGEEKDGKVIEKGTMCKMARGEMVRFLAERQAKTPEIAKQFDRLGYRFDPVQSQEELYVFLKQGH